MAMMQILIRMSIQGSIIVGIVLILRMVFRGLRISYRYCVLLWGIVFFISYFPGRSGSMQTPPREPSTGSRYPRESHSHHREQLTA